MFNGKVCIITGAASGLGLEISRQLLQYGAYVCLADVDQKGLQDAQLHFQAYSANLLVVPFDATDQTQITELISNVLKWAGTIDFMFNNAGIGGSLAIEKATNEHWERIINLNLWSVIHCIEAVLPTMLEKRSGHIINTASISGLIPVPGQALYNTTKFAIVGLSESLRLELASKGIHVSVICPGPFVSKIWGKPILGESADIPPPVHATSVEEIANDTLHAVVNNPGIVVTPRAEKRNWKLHRWLPSLIEKSLKKRLPH